VQPVQRIDVDDVAAIGLRHPESPIRRDVEAIDVEAAWGIIRQSYRAHHVAVLIDLDQLARAARTVVGQVLSHVGVAARPDFDVRQDAVAELHVQVAVVDAVQSRTEGNARLQAGTGDVAENHAGGDVGRELQDCIRVRIGHIQEPAAVELEPALQVDRSAGHHVQLGCGHVHGYRTRTRIDPQQLAPRHVRHDHVPAGMNRDEVVGLAQPVIIRGRRRDAVAVVVGQHGQRHGIAGRVPGLADRNDRVGIGNRIVVLIVVVDVQRAMAVGFDVVQVHQFDRGQLVHEGLCRDLQRHHTGGRDDLQHRIRLALDHVQVAVLAQGDAQRIGPAVLESDGSCGVQRGRVGQHRDRAVGRELQHAAAPRLGKERAAGSVEDDVVFVGKPRAAGARDRANLGRGYRHQPVAVVGIHLQDPAGACVVVQDVQGIRLDRLHHVAVLVVAHDLPTRRGRTGPFDDQHRLVERTVRHVALDVYPEHLVGLSGFVGDHQVKALQLAVGHLRVGNHVAVRIRPQLQVQHLGRVDVAVLVVVLDRDPDVDRAVRFPGGDLVPVIVAQRQLEVVLERIDVLAQVGRGLGRVVRRLNARQRTARRGAGSKPWGWVGNARRQQRRWVEFVDRCRS